MPPPNDEQETDDLENLRRLIDDLREVNADLRDRLAAYERTPKPATMRPVYAVRFVNENGSAA